MVNNVIYVMQRSNEYHIHMHGVKALHLIEWEGRSWGVANSMLK